LQRIGGELPTTLLGRLEGQTYITSGYLATLAAFLVLAGALGDVYGRRRMFVIGLVGFGITSVLCGLAPNMELLVLGRLLQGVAIGGLAFGATRGYESQWTDRIAFTSLGFGAVALVAFPILMARSSHPLVPLSMFRIRAFSTINLSTVLIYGVLYTNSGYQAL